MKIRIADMIGKNCITVSDGEMVYRQIFPALQKGEKVDLDFEGVAVLASPFLNASIGHLVKDVKAEDLNRLLVVLNMSPDGEAVLARVINNSKEYYAGKTAQFDTIIARPPGVG